MYFPHFYSFITYFILAISRSNFAQIQWSLTFFNSQDDELFKNVQDFRIWVKFDRVIVKKLWLVFFYSPFSDMSITILQEWRIKNDMSRVICQERYVKTYISLLILYRVSQKELDRAFCLMSWQPCIILKMLFSPLENWNPYANFEYRTISVRF